MVGASAGGVVLERSDPFLVVVIGRVDHDPLAGFFSDVLGFLFVGPAFEDGCLPVKPLRTPRRRRPP
jgi:hypothetical protein